jgi:hypothetical protein
MQKLLQSASGRTAFVRAKDYGALGVPPGLLHGWIINRTMNLYDLSITVII